MKPELEKILMKVQKPRKIYGWGTEQRYKEKRRSGCTVCLLLSRHIRSRDVSFGDEDPLWSAE